MSKKRGAPKGNRNALKHGFYSRAYTNEERGELSQLDDNPRRNNIKFFKVIIARTAARINPSAPNPLSFKENVAALHTLVIAISRLVAAINAKRRFLKSREAENERDIVEFMRRTGSTEEEIDREIYGITPAVRSGNKRGAQPGNLNALKHGFYSSNYRPEELRRLDKLDEDDLSEEVVLLKIVMKRVFVGLGDDIPLLDYLRAVRVLSYADACLERLNRGRGLLFDGKSLFDLLQDAVREANEEEGIIP